MTDEPVRIPIEAELDLHAFAPRDIAVGRQRIRRRRGPGRSSRGAPRPRPRPRRAARHRAGGARTPSARRRVLETTPRRTSAPRSPSHRHARSGVGYRIRPLTAEPSTGSDRYPIPITRHIACPCRTPSAPLVGRKSLIRRRAICRAADSARERPMRDADSATSIASAAISCSSAARAGASSTSARTTTAELVTLTGSGAAVLGVERRFLTPFDTIEPIDRRTRPRVVRAARWRRACRALIAADGRPARWQAARDARIDLLPHQLEPALAILRGHGIARPARRRGRPRQDDSGGARRAPSCSSRGAIDRVLVLTPPGLRDQWRAGAGGALRDSTPPPSTAACCAGWPRRCRSASIRGRRCRSRSRRSTTSSGRRCCRRSRRARGIWSSSTKRTAVAGDSDRRAAVACARRRAPPMCCC